MPRSARRFVDRVRILVKGGDGGAGCASRFRDAYVEFGPPNGGNGGKGGDVVLQATHNADDLFLPKKNFTASGGTRGQGDDQHGKRGEPLRLMVPRGTIVHQLGERSISRSSQMEPRDSKQTLLAELLHHGDEVVVARGGAPGRGNAAFHSTLNQHSFVAEDGGVGEAVTLLLSLKLIADVGLVGFPNAGKSSLLRALSNATPEVASYPFTTLFPHLGRVRATPLPDDEFTVADIPGLIDGAHANKGLGHQFLRHIERTSLLCYVLDLSDTERSPITQLTSLQEELELYKPGLASQPCMIVANKADTEDAASAIKRLRSGIARERRAGNLPGLIINNIHDDSAAGGGGSDNGGSGGVSTVTAVSALHAENLPRLVRRMLSNLRRAKKILDGDAKALAAQLVQEAEASSLEARDKIRRARAEALER